MKFLYLKGIDIFGPLEAEQLTKEEVFSGDLLVCPEDKAEQESAWKPASRYDDFKAFLEKDNAVVDNEPKEETKEITINKIPAPIEEVKIQDTNISQDLPPLEDTETETSQTEPEEFSFQQIMDDMADKKESNSFDEDEDMQDHTFHIANKEDNLLEDLPAHSLFGPE